MSTPSGYRPESRTGRDSSSAAPWLTRDLDTGRLDDRSLPELVRASNTLGRARPTYPATPLEKPDHGVAGLNRSYRSAMNCSTVARVIACKSVGIPVSSTVVQDRVLAYCLMVGRAGLEPATQGL